MAEKRDGWLHLRRLILLLVHNILGRVNHGTIRFLLLQLGRWIVTSAREEVYQVQTSFLGHLPLLAFIILRLPAPLLLGRLERRCLLILAR